MSKYGPKPTPVLVRAWRKIDVRTLAECWPWTAGCMASGYAEIGSNRTMVYVHRVIYEAVYGPIPPDYDVDHVCHNRAVLAGTCKPEKRLPCPHKKCCNPTHLEAVPHAVNVERGAAPSALLHRDGMCSNGHAMTPENTYTINTSSREGTVRRCRTCRIASARRYQARVRAGRPEFTPRP